METFVPFVLLLYWFPLCQSQFSFSSAQLAQPYRVNPAHYAITIKTFQNATSIAYEWETWVNIRSSDYTQLPTSGPFVEVPFCTWLYGFPVGSLFVSTFGFVTITPRTSCYSFESCSDYTLSSTIRSMPFFAAGLSPRYSETIYRVSSDKLTSRVIVEWRHMNGFSVQMEVRSTGMVIYRYQSNGVTTATNLTSGITLSDRQKDIQPVKFDGNYTVVLLERLPGVYGKFINGQSAANSTVNRTESNQIYTACDALNSCQDCSKYIGCLWCISTQMCLDNPARLGVQYNASRTADYCPPGNYLIGTCNMPLNDTERYRVLYVNKDNFINISAWRNVTRSVASDWDDGETGRPYEQILNGSGFAFPFFYNPPAASPSRSFSTVYQTKQIFESVYISPNGFISLDGSFPTDCMENANTVPTFCTPDLMSQVISPLQADFWPGDPSRRNSSYVQWAVVNASLAEPYALLKTGELKSTIEMTMGSTYRKGYGQSVIIQYNDVSLYYKKTDNQTLDSLLGLTDRFTFQVQLYPNGVIAMRYKKAYTTMSNSTTCPSGNVFYSPGVPRVLIKKSEKSSTLVSAATHWSMLRENSEILIIPELGCEDNCNELGMCKRASGFVSTCQCNVHVAGASCTSCESQYYGFDCQKSCSGKCKKGVCSDGVLGTGACQCSEGYGGEICEYNCNCTRPGCGNCTSSCNAPYGFCACGVCECKFPYYGAQCLSSCQQIRDCEACRHIPPGATAPQCTWCMADAGGRCVSNSSQGSGCTTFLQDGATCPSPELLIPNESEVNSTVTLLVLALVFLLIILCLGVVALMICFFKHRKPPGEVAQPVTAWLLERGYSGEREVIPIHHVPSQSAPVLGIPLQQIPLNELRSELVQARGTVANSNGLPISSGGTVINPDQPDVVPAEGVALNTTNAERQFVPLLMDGPPVVNPPPLPDGRPVNH